MDYPDLTKRQAEILDYIKYCVQTKKLPPSVREIGEAIGLSSPSSVHVHLKVLEDKGYISRVGSRSRAVVLTDKGEGKGRRRRKAVAPAPEQTPVSNDDHSSLTLPLVGSVAAGSPILAEQNIEEKITLPISLVGDTGSFLLRVKGDSMIEAGIFNGDIVIVKEQNTADNGQIVVALLEDGATVKTYYREKDCVRLQPQNPALEPIFTTDVQLLGVVTGLFRSM